MKLIGSKKIPDIQGAGQSTVTMKPARRTNVKVGGEIYPLPKPGPVIN